MSKTFDKKKLINGIKLFVPYLLVFLLIFFVQYKTLDFEIRDFNVPTFYNEGGDSSMTIYRSFEMRDDHALFQLNQLGAPNGSNTFDFYAFDLFLYFIQFLCSNLAPSAMIGYNIFIIASAWFNGIAAYYALKRLKVKTPMAVALSVLYGLLPFFYMRYRSHSYIAYYFAAPLAIAFATEIYRGEFILSLKKEERKKSLGNAILLIIIGMSGMYYSIFSCMFFLLATMLHMFENKSIKKGFTGLKTIFVTFIGFLITAAPTLVYWAKNGSVIADRWMWDGEQYSLRLTDLIFPVYCHRIGKLATFKNIYTSSLPTSGEASSATLGFIFSLGLLFIFVNLFRIAASDKKETIRPMTFFALAALLVGTRGGFSTIFNLILPFIRCYSRISVYIAFCCAVAFAAVAESFFEFLVKKFNKQTLIKCVSVLFACGVLVVGLFDQTISLGAADNYGNSIDYKQDEVFVNNVVEYAHQLDPDDQMVDCVFLPFMAFPENHYDTGGKLVGYEPMTLCVHSSDFAVSYGAQDKRPQSEELHQVFEMDMEDQIDYYISNGYDGIVVSFASLNALDPDYITSIKKELGEPDFANGRYMFWSLEDN